MKNIQIITRASSLARAFKRLSNGLPIKKSTLPVHRQTSPRFLLRQSYFIRRRWNFPSPHFFSCYKTIHPPYLVLHNTIRYRTCCSKKIVQTLTSILRLCSNPSHNFFYWSSDYYQPSFFELVLFYYYIHLKNERRTRKSHHWSPSKRSTVDVLGPIGYCSHSLHLCHSLSECQNTASKTNFNWSGHDWSSYCLGSGTNFSLEQFQQWYQSATEGSEHNEFGTAKQTSTSSNVKRKKRNYFQKCTFYDALSTWCCLLDFECNFRLCRLCIDPYSSR